MEGRREHAPPDSPRLEGLADARVRTGAFHSPCSFLHLSASFCCLCQSPATLGPGTPEVRPSEARAFKCQSAMPRSPSAHPSTSTSPATPPTSTTSRRYSRGERVNQAHSAQLADLRRAFDANPELAEALFAIADDTRGHMGARRRGKAIAAHGDEEEPATRTRWSRSRTTSRSSSSDSESSTAARPAWERSGPFRRGSSDRAFTSERLRDHRGEDASSSPDESSLSSDAEEGIQGVARPLLSSSGRKSDASLRAPGDARGREERRNSRTKVSAPTCASLLSLLFPLSLGAEALNDRFRQQGRPA